VDPDSYLFVLGVFLVYVLLGTVIIGTFAILGRRTPGTRDDIEDDELQAGDERPARDERETLAAAMAADLLERAAEYADPIRKIEVKIPVRQGEEVPWDALLRDYRESGDITDVVLLDVMLEGKTPLEIASRLDVSEEVVRRRAAEVKATLERAHQVRRYEELLQALEREASESPE
jgi:hypothetical protein